MKLAISSVDHAPEELHNQVPLTVRLLRELPGDDRPDYWLAELDAPISWNDESDSKTISHFIITARWAGMHIEPLVENIPINIAYVTDEAQLEESRVDFNKSVFIAIGLASEIEGGKKTKPLESVLAGNIARAFGVGKSK